ncbi:hypothetical protein MUK42_21338, partial [Musa troglodytarum]
GHRVVGGAAFRPAGGLQVIRKELARDRRRRRHPTGGPSRIGPAGADQPQARRDPRRGVLPAQLLGGGQRASLWRPPIDCVGSLCSHSALAFSYSSQAANMVHVMHVISNTTKVTRPRRGIGGHRVTENNMYYT